MKWNTLSTIFTDITWTIDRHMFIYINYVLNTVERISLYWVDTTHKGYNNAYTKVYAAKIYIL